VIHAVGEGIKTAFAEDCAIIEAQQQVMNESPHVRPKAAAVDAALNRVRFLIDKALQQEAQAHPTIPVIPVQERV